MKKQKFSMLILLICAFGLIFNTGCDLLDDDSDPLNGDNDQEDNDHDYGSVADADGNEYKTIVIGSQEWMAENLQTTKYRDGSSIPGGLSDAEWNNATYGAYAIYPHQEVSGIGSAQEMVAAYGKLYNWFAVSDSRGLCPAGWKVPSHNDWTELTDYLIDNYAGIEGHNAGNFLKSCRQVDSPIGGNCNTTAHPRWNSNNNFHGNNEFGFAALPAGWRSIHRFDNMGVEGTWWTSTAILTTNARVREILNYYGNVFVEYRSHNSGLSVRCIRAN